MEGPDRGGKQQTLGRREEARSEKRQRRAPPASGPHTSDLGKQPGAKGDQFSFLLF